MSNVIKLIRVYVGASITWIHQVLNIRLTMFDSEELQVRRGTESLKFRYFVGLEVQRI